MARPVVRRVPVPTRGRVQVARAVTVDQISDMAKITTHAILAGVAIYGALNWQFYRGIRKRAEKKDEE